jgi:hypothetical protein
MVTLAASKLKTGWPVPETNAIVTTVLPNMSASPLDRQFTVVPDVQDVEKHTPRSAPPPRSSPAVVVCSPMPKLRPETVTEAYPVCGAFKRTSDATAASKVKIGRPVPVTNTIVTLADRNKSANGFDRHASDVADIQDDVMHAPRSPPPPRSSPAVAVNSPTPKLSPITVTDAYPECGTLRRTSDTTAASKLNIPRPVPAMLPTVTCK